MFYVLSDPHGCCDAFATALSHWDKNNEKLIILGDLIDRGPDSLIIVQTCRILKEKYPDNVVILKGNHDEMFVDWLLEIPEEDLGFYYMNGHNETILSFYGHDKTKFNRDTRKQRGQYIRHNYMKELHFLNDLPMYHETDNCLFVHAGIDLALRDKWREDTREMNWIRNTFIYSRIQAPKTTFFGHTPTTLIRDEQNNHDIWVSEHGDKVGIDGGCVFGGQLNTLKIDENGNIRQKFAITKDAVTM